MSLRSVRGGRPQGKARPYGKTDMPYDQQNKNNLLCIVPICSYVPCRGTSNRGKQNAVYVAQICLLLGRGLVWLRTLLLCPFYSANGRRIARAFHLLKKLDPYIQHTSNTHKKGHNANSRATTERTQFHFQT